MQETQHQVQSDNVWVDGQAGYNITNSNGGDNTFKGHDAGYNTNGGSVAGTLGNHNSFYGHESGFKNTLRNDIACKSGYSMNESVTAKYVPCLGFDTG